MDEKMLEEFKAKGGVVTKVPAGVRGLPFDLYDPEELTWVAGGELTVHPKKRIIKEVDGDD